MSGGLAAAILPRERLQKATGTRETGEAVRSPQEHVKKQNVPKGRAAAPTCRDADG